MFSFLHRKRLVSKGLACERRRLCPQDEGWRAFLDESAWVRWLVLTAWGGALAALCFVGDLPAAWESQTLLLTAVLFAAATLLLRLQYPGVWRRNSRLSLMALAVLVNLGMTKGLLLNATPAEAGPAGYYLHLIPTAFAPMLVGVLLGAGPGVFAAVFASLFASALVRDGGALLVTSLLTGVLAVLFSRDLRKRSQLLRAGGYAGLAGLVTTLVFAPGRGVEWHAMLPQAAMAAGVGIATALVVSALLPVLENVFKITTGISWLEMADLNHPLLKRLTMEAPGTYHHSLVVANLVEAAAQAIGADALQCRVSAYFHDIGKIEKPEYFTENQAFGRNPHDDLAPTMSALIVMSHVKEGAHLALEHHLNPAIVDAIREHHGTTRVSYFHARALQQERDARAGVRLMHLREEDVPRVSEETFRYAGPKPQSRETALLMLADACEGASRSLDRPSPQDVEELVRDIVKDRIEDGQFDECPITMQELQLAADRLAATLKTMMHSRIAYPKDDDDDEEEKRPRDRAGQPPAPAPDSPHKAPRAA